MSSASFPPEAYQPPLEVLAPAEGATVGGLLSIRGFCEAGGTVSLLYLPAGSAWAASENGVNPASVACVDCRSARADCGPGVNQRGGFRALVKPVGSPGSRNIVVSAEDAMGNAANNVDRALNMVPPAAGQAYVKASNTDALDGMGTALAADGDTLVVGAPLEDSNSAVVNQGADNDGLAGAGAAYVYTWNGAAWSQVAYLKPPDPEQGAGFGSSVAVHGDTVVVGAPYRGGDPPNQAFISVGAAYVFERLPGTDTWVHQQVLRASDAAELDNFGASVAVHGDIILVGAPGESSASTGVGGATNDVSAAGAGAAYAFERNGLDWTQVAYLKAANTGAGDAFGTSVAVHGSQLAVGAPYEDSNGMGLTNNSINDSGAVYTFTAGSPYLPGEVLKAPSPAVGERLGYAVALRGDRMVAGAPAFGDAVMGTGQPGRAVAYSRPAATWGTPVVLGAPAAWAHGGMEMGTSVAVDAGRFIVGAPRNKVGTSVVNDLTGGGPAPLGATPEGAVFVFGWDGSAQRAYKSPNRTTFNGDAEGDLLGASVAAADGRTFMGAPQEDGAGTGVGGNAGDNTARDSGAAWVFTD